MKPKPRTTSVERAGTNPAKLANAIGIGDREQTVARAKGALSRLRNWRSIRRERRYEEMMSTDGRAAHLRYEANRTWGDTGKMSGSDGGGGGGGF